MDVNTPSTSELKLFEFGSQKKLILLSCTVFLWIGTLIAYFSPDFNYALVASFNSLRNDPLFAGFWYYYTLYMLYVVEFPLIMLYLVSFRVNKLKPYRLTLFLAIITLAIGNPIIDPLMKNYFAIPRPWITYPDINSLYYVRGFSFPSGHAFQSFAATLPLIICLLTNDSIFKRNWKKITLASILFILALILAFSRVLAGVHYISDVLFGIGFAVFLMTILAALMQWLLKNDYLNLENEKWYALIFLTITVINIIMLR